MSYPSPAGGINTLRANRESGGTFSLPGRYTNLFQDREKTLIMKFPFLHFAFLLLAVITILAGCSSTPSAPGNVSPSSGALQTAAGTPAQYNALSQLELLPDELPFVVKGETTQVPNMKDPVLSQFAATRGYTRFVINETAESANSAQIGQVIVDYPPGNATRAYTAFVSMNRNADQSQYRITWLPDPGIGDLSCAFIVADRSGATKPKAIIVFVKSHYMESVVMIAPSPDMAVLTQQAKFAAAKIPP
jgi:hypothetical protein